MGSDGQAGFVILPAEIMELGPKIGSAALHVYAVLAQHADEDGVCWPSVRRVAEIAGMSVATVRRSLKALVDESAIRVEVRTENGVQSSNLYRLLITREHPYENDRGGYQKEHDPLSNLPPPPCQKRKGAPVKNVRGTRTIEQDPVEPKKRARKTVVEVTLPEGLETPEFKRAWGEWITYRREEKYSVKPMALKAQLTKLNGFGETLAIRSIRESIAGTWKGLFWPKENGKPVEKPPNYYEPGKDPDFQ